MMATATAHSRGQKHKNVSSAMNSQQIMMVSERQQIPQYQSLTMQLPMQTYAQGSAVRALRQRQESRPRSSVPRLSTAPRDIHSAATNVYQQPLPATRGSAVRTFIVDTEQMTVSGQSSQPMLITKQLPIKASIKLIPPSTHTSQSFHQSTNHQQQQQLMMPSRKSMHRQATFNQPPQTYVPSSIVSLTGSGNSLKENFNLQANQTMNVQNYIHQQAPVNSGIQLLPSTPKQCKRTRRDYFARRMTMKDHPLLIISFIGVMGDFSRPALWAKVEVDNTNPLQQLNIRAGLSKGMQFLSQNFQVIIFNNYSPDLTDQSYKDRAERIRAFVTQQNILVDAIYSSTINFQEGKRQYMSEDYSQIFQDFIITDLKRVNEKVLFIQALEMDSLGIFEPIRIDPKGFFMFDMSQQPASPLVTGIPLYIDNSGVPTMETTKFMPLVLLVPSCRGQYYNQQQGITFISIVKTIMAMSFIAQQKSKIVSLDQQHEALHISEWDIGVQKTLISLRIRGSTALKDEGEETPTDNGISYKQIVRTYSSNSNLQGSLERQGMRSTSAQSDDKIGQQQPNINDQGNDDFFSDMIQFQLNDKYLQNINWSRYFESQKQEFTQTGTSMLGLKLVQSNIFWRYLQKEQQSYLLLQKVKNDRVQQLKKYQKEVQTASELHAIHSATCTKFQNCQEACPRATHTRLAAC
ncbi:hypothetical protein FGO68_gene16382 [Halteria grandinella]|uniref:Uncharacterized protein n=1 Tax=Halteria grandinella TaxID=5974 RepID=A0A8J8NX89_HALGN|nr:hypothetical protein FGO68_gene16382 [Halteria grandinella]